MYNKIVNVWKYVIDKYYDGAAKNGHTNLDYLCK